MFFDLESKFGYYKSEPKNRHIRWRSELLAHNKRYVAAFIIFNSIQKHFIVDLKILYRKCISFQSSKSSTGLEA